MGTPHRRAAASSEPLVTVACHEDLSASDLVGRYLLSGEETVWIDGPLTRAVNSGAICYLDEIVEARKDTMVLIHALTDHRRMLPVEKRSLVLNAHDDFLLVMSYNPGYQSVLKDLKPSTRQRFVSLAFDYPPHDLEAAIIARESGVDAETAGDLATLGAKVRHLRQHGFEEGVSTRLLVYAGQLIRARHPGAARLRGGGLPGRHGRRRGAPRHRRAGGDPVSVNYHGSEATLQERPGRHGAPIRHSRACGSPGFPGFVDSRLRGNDALGS